MLNRVNSSQDLKKLTIEELKLLSQEIRDLIVRVVSQKGGHLASSLGAVELCLALHYCFDTPQDSIIFDVGHQAYAHKIITGRKKSFSTLREYKGISGFPNYQESAYDLYISGHASTAISWAQGLAEAKRLEKDKTKTIAVVGDGSLTGGMCFEALNSCGHSQNDVLVVVNHNEMSISPSVGALSAHLTKIISAPIYNRIKNELESFLEHFSLIKGLVKRARKFEESVKGLVVPGIFFEELGFRYFGPIDGHNLEALVPTLINVATLSGPRVLHVITKKGKGYVHAEENPEYFHGTSGFDVETGQSDRPVKETFSDIFAKKLIILAEKDPKIVAITAAMPKGTGLDLFGKKFPGRLFDVGIAESHAVGFASGLAKRGLKPVVAIYSTFLQRAYDQIIHDVALQNLGVIFAIDRSGVVGEDGPTHHGVFDIGYLRAIPNMVCLAPKDGEEFQNMLEFATSLKKPVSIRYPREAAYSLDKKQAIEIGKSELIRAGEDVCLIALGSMVRVAVECSDLLAKEGIKLTVVNARFIKPLDEDLLKQLVLNHDLIITIEEGNLAGGFGSAVIELYESYDLLKKTKLIRVGFPDEFIPAAKRKDLLNMYGLDAESLSGKIRKALETRSVKK
ncbi:MAG: 1-deoxy-D-xylulose-5-phosphate synthase [Candidatus Omnitrophica bacterium]|nr:1-deoxy-D-xylulose-5-phosphate synthase [Candidatus Omnitrophota bacterium]